MKTKKILPLEQRNIDTPFVSLELYRTAIHALELCEELILDSCEITANTELTNFCENKSAA